MNIDKLEFRAFMDRLLDRFDMLDEKLEKLARSRSRIDGEELLDNQDVLMALKISERTLQRFRSSGELPYYTLHGKSYYKLSDAGIAGSGKRGVEKGRPTQRTQKRIGRSR